VSTLSGPPELINDGKIKLQLLMNLPQTKLSALDAWLPDQWKLNQTARCAALKKAASLTP
jgi:hypothetical protein